MAIESGGGLGASEKVTIDVRPGASDEEIKKGADVAFMQMLNNSANLFWQQVPDNGSASGMIGQLTEKGKAAASNEGDPAAADMDTGIQ